MKIRKALCAAVLLLTACVQQQPRTVLAPSDLEDIKALHQAYVTAWLKDDTSGVLHTLTPEAVLLPSGIGPIKGMSEIKNFWFPNDGSRTKITDFATSIEELSGSGDLAFVRGQSRLAFTYEKDGSKSELKNEGMFLAIVQRQSDHTWRITHQMWGPLKK